MTPILNFRVIPALAACGALVASPPLMGAGADDPGFVEEARQEARETVNEISAYSVEQKEKALNAAEDGIAELEDNIEEVGEYLDEKGDRISAESREEYNEMLDDLRSRRNDLQDEYRELATASDDTWDDAKSAFTEAFQTVQKAWDETVREIRQTI